MNGQTLIGVLVALASAVGLWHARWLVAETPKGRRLAEKIGDDRAVLILRGFLAAGVAFGALLAADVIRPVQW